MTEKMQDAAKLQESEETFRLLVLNVKDYAIFMLDPHGHVVSWNAGAAQIKGYLGSEIVGRHFSAFYLPEDIAAGKPERLIQRAREQGSVQDEGWRVRKDGSLFWANVTLTAIYDEHRQLRGFAKVTRDMSERKRLEEVEASARRMKEFLATLAHELRNPLAPMYSATSIMERAPEDVQLVRTNLGIVSRQLRHLTRLVDDLLDVGRIAAGKLEMRRSVIPVREVISAAIEGSMPAFEAKAQRIETQLDNADFHVFGDLIRLAQVLQNLLINASKFSPEGTTITLRCGLNGRIGQLSVADQAAASRRNACPRYSICSCKAGNRARPVRVGWASGCRCAGRSSSCMRGRSMQPARVLAWAARLRSGCRSSPNRAHRQLPCCLARRKASRSSSSTTIAMPPTAWACFSR